MKPSILFITKTNEYIATFREALQGYNITTCVSDKQALEIFNTQDISLVIIDEILTSTSGCALFGKLREKKPWLAGIILTENANEALLRQLYEIGFSGFLEKPVSAKDLLERVNMALASTGLQEENTRLRTLIPLYSLGEQFLSSSTEREVLDGLLDVVVSQVGDSVVSVMLFDEVEGCLKIAAARGIDKNLITTIRVNPGDKISGWVFQKGKPVILNKDTQESSIFAPLLKRPEITSAISFPMMMRGRILGVLNVSHTSQEGRFSEADNEMLTIICSQASMALENVRSLKLLEEKTRMRTLFEQYVDPEVADILIASDSNLLELGEIKEATVLFADIRNSTSLVQRLELTELRSFLNEVFSLFTEEVFANRGTVDKFMGDAVLAIFGAPIELENSNLIAVETAQKIRYRFELLRQKYANNRDDFSGIGLGMGITSGKMFFGNVGSLQRFDYTVIGTEVNIAQRLASESLSYEIYITENVKKDIEHHMQVSQIGVKELRGIKGKIPVFSIR